MALKNEEGHLASSSGEMIALAEDVLAALLRKTHIYQTSRTAGTVESNFTLT